MFVNKFPKLTAAIQRQEHSEQEIDALNKELLERQVRGLAIIRQSDLHSFEHSLCEALEKNSGLEAQVIALATERDQLKALVQEYGDQPGAMPTAVVKKKDELQSPQAFTVDLNTDYNRRALKATGADSAS